MTSNSRLHELISRLARLDASDTWGGDLNPAQMSAIGYLSRANRFSRSPSHVADYLQTTRGTMSQTLKALERKGYVSEARSDADKRAKSYRLTAEGEKVAARPGDLSDAIGALSDKDRTQVEDALSSALISVISKNDGRPFGVCKTCRYHQRKGDAPYCRLLNLSLKPEEAFQICHEQRA